MAFSPSSLIYAALLKEITIVNITFKSEQTSKRNSQVLRDIGLAKKKKEPIWIARELAKCSGCRKCEIACSLFHENQIWPEASMIRVFMLVPGADFPHFCAQCQDYPCVQSCPVKALSISKQTAAVLVDKETCIACGKCIDACPGRIPHMHPKEKYIVICDLCNGDPQCVKVAEKADGTC